MIFLRGLQDHIKVIILVLANHAETFANAYNKNAKWQYINRTKITSHFEFHQTKAILQTNATMRCQIIWAPHPQNILTKFKFFLLRPLCRTLGRQGGHLSPC